MSVEFQLGHQDHDKVEDFLARDSGGVGAISLHPKFAGRQLAAAAAARDAGLDVLYDPRTEVLAAPGLTLNGLPGYTGTPYDLDTLSRSIGERQVLVDAVLTAHPELTTIVTPPHFFVRDDRTAHLNLAMAEAAKLSTDKPVRPVLLFRSRMSLPSAASIAKEYADAGFDEVELRFTPLGGENDSIAKIRAVFSIADAFSAQGLRVVLGRSGNIGQAAFALGHVHGYTTGIGQLEKVDYASAINRQSIPAKLDEHGKKKGGVWEGVYLPGLAMTVSKKTAQRLLANSDIRTRIGCRIGHCANSLTGPTNDHKGHYLHARASDMAKLVETPAAWRAKSETDRLRRAIELRQLVNKSYRGTSEPDLKVRTLVSLVDDIQEARGAAVA